MSTIKMYYSNLLLIILISLLLNVSITSNIVYRDVTKYGAKGDGITDDTDAIITALTEGRSDNGAPFPSVYSCSTQHPAYVYFPNGVYVVTQTLPIVYYTMMIGDENNWPTIKFISTSKVDTRVLDVAGSWYPDISQNNFYRQIRNFIIDMTKCTKCTGIHWKVAQATMLQNVYFKAGIGSNNQGMWMEDGSGGLISDLVFEGGLFGMWVGNQQFTSRNITIRNTSVAAIYLNWDWVWTFIGLTIENSPVGIDLGSATGTLVVLDSTFSGIQTSAIRTNYYNASSDVGANSIYLENFTYQMNTPGSTKAIVSDGTTTTAVATGPVTTISFAQGVVFDNIAGTAKLIQAEVTSTRPVRPSVLTTKDGTYLSKKRPLFDGSTLVNVTDFGIIGDGLTDVTAALQSLLLKTAGKGSLFFPYGVYIITDTIYVPPGTQMIGEVWSVLMVAGTNFADASVPKPVFKVGEVGEVGVVYMLDLLFSTQGPQPGAILVEWNMHEPAGNQGACGMWSVHFRIGGAIGTKINPSNCPAGNGENAPASECTGAYLLMHVTKSASIYMEDVWGWVYFNLLLLLF